MDFLNQLQAEKEEGGPAVHPRGEMEDGPIRTENTVTTGTATTNKQKILRGCGCGWSNVTTYTWACVYTMGRQNVAVATRFKLALRQQVRRGGIIDRLSTTALPIPSLRLVREGKTCLPSRIRTGNRTAYCTSITMKHQTENPQEQHKGSLSENPKSSGQKPVTSMIGQASTQTYTPLSRTHLRSSTTTKLNIFGHIIWP